MFVVNPSGGAGACGRRWALDGGAALAAAARATGRTPRVALTSARGDAERLAREASEGGAELVVAVGGDGTCHEVLNGLFAAQKQHTKWPPRAAASQPRAARPVGRSALGVLPCGTGCDLARSLGLGGGWDEAVAALAGGRRRRVDVGRVSCRDAVPQLFANVASAGVSASSGRYVGPTKRLGARVAYSAATVAAFASYRPPTLRLRRMGVGDAPGDVDGHAGAGAEAALEEVVESVTALAVCNGQYFGGGFRIAPDADAGDGLLDAVGLQGFGLLEFARLGGFLRRGEHMGIEGVSMRRSSALLVEVAEEDEGTGRAHSCVLRSPADDGDSLCDPYGFGEEVVSPIDVEADGEMVGTLPALFEVLPDAIEMVVP